MRTFRDDADYDITAAVEAGACCTHVEQVGSLIAFCAQHTPPRPESLP
jgi:hypothetical protein